MSERNVIKIDNLSKQYRLGLVGTGTLSHDINRWWHLIRGKEDPYLKIGESNDRTVSGNSKYVWALRGINLSINEGEVLGIIGKNGAGKSTLLKILSRVTGPSLGSIKVKGRIGALLEVGTGFHPELTGKENIYLNGAILGMSKEEITSKLDEIVEFSGTKKYLNTPVKRYSSGMIVRLGFAVAAHLEPEILVIDEVLAVGDAEFQKKAIGKMDKVSSSKGRSILFVSHNMASIKKLCNRVIVLEQGKIVFNGDTKEAIDYYLNINSSINEFPTSIDQESLDKGYEGITNKNSFMKLRRIDLLNEDDLPQSTYSSQDEIRIRFWFRINFSIAELRIVISIVDEENTPVLTTQISDDPRFNHSLSPAEYSAICYFPKNLFASKVYNLTVQFINPKKEHYIFSGIVKFKVEYVNENYIYAPFDNTYFRPNLNWSLERNQGKYVER